MKILVASNMYPSDADPSCGPFIRRFTDGIRMCDPDGQMRLVAIKGRRKGALSKAMAYAAYYTKLFTALVTRRYDIVYVHKINYASIPVRAASMFRKLPLVINVHGDDVIPRGRIQSLLKKLSRPLFRKASMVVCPSEYYKDTLRREFPEIAGTPVAVSPSGGIDESFFIKKEPRGNTATLTLGFVSRIDTGKGWDTFLDAVLMLGKKGIVCRGIMAGRGSQVDMLQAAIAAKGLHDTVSYIGAVPPRELPSLYASMDLFLFPTTRLNESLGLVGIEAMAAGTPAIASDMAGPAGYVVDGDNGYLFKPGSVEALVGKIMLYISLSTAEKQKMSDAAYAAALPYAAGNVARKLFKRLEERFSPVR